jgi:hypothetical protein
MTGQILELYWRETRMGGLTDHLVVCPTCRSVIPPYSRTSSSGGTHGVAFYDHPHPVAVLSLIQSNKSMNRHHGLTIPEGGGDDIKALLEEAGSLWDVRKLGSRLDVEEFVLNRLSNTAPHEGDMLEKLLSSRNPSEHLQKCLEKRRAFLNLVEKLGYRQLTEAEEVFLTAYPDKKEHLYFIWSEESDDYLFEAYIEAHVRDGDEEVLAIVLVLRVKRLIPNEWLEVKQYVLDECENFREMVKKFIEEVEGKGKTKAEKDN